MALSQNARAAAARAAAVGFRSPGPPRQLILDPLTCWSFISCRILRSRCSSSSPSAGSRWRHFWAAAAWGCDAATSRQLLGCAMGPAGPAQEAALRQSNLALPWGLGGCSEPWDCAMGHGRLRTDWWIALWGTELSPAAAAERTKRPVAATMQVTQMFRQPIKQLALSACLRQCILFTFLQVQTHTERSMRKGEATRLSCQNWPSLAVARRKLGGWVELGAAAPAIVCMISLRRRAAAGNRWLASVHSVSPRCRTVSHA